MLKDFVDSFLILSLGIIFLLEARAVSILALLTLITMLGIFSFLSIFDKVCKVFDPVILT
jgi:hypothetical protein